MVHDGQERMRSWEDGLLLVPALASLAFVWIQFLPTQAIVTWLATGFNASVSLLFVLAGWRTVPVLAAPGRAAGMNLLRRAAIRFLPLHLAVLALSVGCALAFRDQGFSRIGSVPVVDGLSLISNLLLVHGWFPAQVFLDFWNPALWIFGAGLLWLQVAPGLVRGLERCLRAFSPLAVVLGLWGVAFVAIQLAWRLVPPEILDMDGRRWFFVAFPPLRLWEFALGALVRLALDRPIRPGGVRDRLEIHRVRHRLLLLLPLLLGALIWASPDVLGGHLGWAVSLPFLTAPLWGLLLLTLAKAGLSLPSRLAVAGRLSCAIPFVSPWAFWGAVALRHEHIPLTLSILYPLVAVIVSLGLELLVVRPGRMGMARLWPLRQTAP